MNRQASQRVARLILPIHWLKPSAFNIPIPRDEKRIAALDCCDILDRTPGDRRHRKR